MKYFKMLPKCRNFPQIQSNCLGMIDYFQGTDWVQAGADVCITPESSWEEASLQGKIPGDIPNLPNAPGKS